MSKFKAGDKVVVNEEFDYIAKGAIGYVCELSAANEVQVKFGDTFRWFHPSHLELKPNPMFKIGDKVRILSVEGHTDWNGVGCIGTIASKNCEGYKVEFCIDGKIDWWYCNDSNLELCESDTTKEESLFKIGDKVRIINKSHNYFNCCGEITKIVIDQNWKTLNYIITVSSNPFIETKCISDGDLELVDDQEFELTISGKNVTFTKKGWEDLSGTVLKYSHTLAKYLVKTDLFKYWLDRNDFIVIHDSTTTPTDNINHPAHYNTGKIEVYDFIVDQKLNYPLGNAIKYICRSKHKGKELEDLKKAAWYLAREISRLEKEGNHNE